jgi:hypothetical protein
VPVPVVCWSGCEADQQRGSFATEPTPAVFALPPPLPLLPRISLSQVLLLLNGPYYNPAVHGVDKSGMISRRLPKEDSSQSAPRDPICLEHL